MDNYLGGVNVHASLFIDHCHGYVLFICKIFVIGLNRKIILTVKFSLMYGIAGHKIIMFLLSICSCGPQFDTMLQMECYI